jgi:hypothetical protein
MERGGKGFIDAWHKMPVLAGVLLWLVEVYMAYNFVTPLMPSSSGFFVALMAFIIQIALTAGQMPVFEGRGGMLSYVCLFIGAVINFGGVMSLMVNIDQVGSVQALQASFGGTPGPWPIQAKAFMGLVFSAILCPTPEYLISLGRR